MHHTFTRRTFFRTTTAAGLAVTGAPFLAGVASAIQPLDRQGKANMNLSLAAYSFRQFFKDGGGKAAPDKQIDLFDFVDYCARHECAAELTSYYFPKGVTDEFLLKLKRHAFLRGVAVSGTAVGNVFTHPAGPKRDAEIAGVKQWIDRAAVLGAPHIRIFAGGVQGTSKEEAKKLCIAAIEDCCEYAGRKGVFLGLENHGGIVAEPGDLLDIVRAVNSPWFGINLDTGNFRTDDPYRDIEQCAPYAVNVQFKSEIRRRTAKRNEPADLKQVLEILRGAKYQGFVALEYEAAEDAWTAVPRLLKGLRDGLRG